MHRDYNGLTGKEVLDLLLIQIRESLSKEGRLSFSQVYHNVKVRGTLEVDSYPHEPRTEVFKVAATSAGEQPAPEMEPETFTADFEQLYEIPDLARDEIDDKQEDINFVTQAEGRGV